MEPAGLPDRASEKNLTQADLIEAIWPDEESDNPANTLKNLVYRARNLLADTFGPEAQLIISQRGAYAWNGEYRCTVDTDEFEALCRAGSDPDASPAVRLDCYARAAALYGGISCRSLPTKCG